jgi:hypothetical protein
MTKACRLPGNQNLSFLGSCKGGDFDVGEAEAVNLLTSTGNPRRKPNSDVIRPIKNSEDLLQRPSGRWIIDNADLTLAQAEIHKKPHAIVVARVKPHRDSNRDKWLRENWWRPQRMRAEMRASIQPLERFLVTPTTSKHRLFLWLEHPVLPDHQLIVFARSDDYFFGVLQSRLHEVWSLAQGTQLREKESGFRYTPTTCFETFPFPFPDDVRPPEPTPALPPPRPKKPEPDRTWAEMMAAHFYMAKEEPTPYDRSSGRESAHSSSFVGNPSRLTSAATKDDPRAAIAAAAKELNDLRERWLNPPEWTVERVLEFPGSVNGPWARYIVRQDSQDLQDAKTAKAAAPVHPVNPVEDAIGIVRYPRLEPRDAGCAAQLKQRTLTNLYNERPGWLDAAHRNLDAAVATAYGWPVDLTDEWILERLLALNQERAEAEAQGAKAPRPKTQRAKRADEMI